MLFTVFNGFKGCLEIAFIVNCVKNTENINATISSMMNEGSNYIVSIVAIAYQVLPPKQHL